ncbi:alpha/beta hydrolase [Paremcibacter congregatus]|uniref:BD-FAE-like domain-containing protein n=1 Tax=Paremcibacter congregatus TaxID=2043170 RepID=A0A2G4YRZ1_9PROT|nr:alpha/beta hydrolase [Paremcibacter congregatus]PHZ85081.1 hypothetical protein CRD36_08545 [Paremcibacter congregatus]QDE27969.1 alpha/beta hydrolase [Paremcibacter congregatus]
MKSIFLVSTLFLISLITSSSSIANIGYISPNFYMKEVSYGYNLKQKLDIYVPNFSNMEQSVKLRPVIIYVRGGSWKFGDKDSAKKHGKFYADKNNVFITINYRLSSNAQHPAQVEDIATAIKWVHKNITKYKGDPENITLIGYSSGAHLISLIATDEKYLAAHDLNFSILKLVIPVDTIAYDLPYAAASSPKSVTELIYNNFGESKKQLEQASPLFHANQTTAPPPPFIVYASNRRPGAAKEARLFVYALEKAGSRSKYIILNHISNKNMNTLISGSNNPIAVDILMKLSQTTR